MQYHLNDTIVPEGMHSRASSVKKRGGKVFLVVPTLDFDDEAEARTKAALAGKSFCANCDGSGKLLLQVFTGGPYKTAAGLRHVTWHEGSWYIQETVQFVCPECRGSGLLVGQAPKPEPVNL